MSDLKKAEEWLVEADLAKSTTTAIIYLKCGWVTFDGRLAFHGLSYDRPSIILIDDDPID